MKHETSSNSPEFVFSVTCKKPNMAGSNRLFINVRSAVLEELATVATLLSKERNELTLAQAQELETVMAMVSILIEEVKQSHSVHEWDTATV